MNRIVLIGNGFDLAHNMKTSYYDFILYYWYQVFKNIDHYNKGQLIINEYSNDLEVNNLKYPEGVLNNTDFLNFLRLIKEGHFEVKFKKPILEYIFKNSENKNWGGVEDDYYGLLKGAFFNENYNYPRYYKDKIEELNKDFNYVKDKLESCLNSAEKHFDDLYKKGDPIILKIKNIIGHNIYQQFDFNDFSESAKDYQANLEYENYKKHSSNIKNEDIDEHFKNTITALNNYLLNKKGDFKALIRKLLVKGVAPNYFDLTPENILFLNFNYTDTHKLYTNSREFDDYINVNYPTTHKPIKIHGSLKKVDKNPIIFGYGDELDEDYREIEKANNNDYLENIKSIKYLETDNYKKLLEFINSDYYQIFVFGHSCSNSDRTLLNTMFEHDNCGSIKVFYHNKPNGESDFSNIIKNISRNFNDKAKMRDRVVNKQNCVPLT